MGLWFRLGLSENPHTSILDFSMEFSLVGIVAVRFYLLPTPKKAGVEGGVTLPYFVSACGCSVRVGGLPKPGWLPPLCGLLQFLQFLLPGLVLPPL